MTWVDRLASVFRHKPEDAQRMEKLEQRGQLAVDKANDATRRAKTAVERLRSEYRIADERLRHS